MKNLFTLIFVCSIFSASAQYSATLKVKDKNPICIERGHNLAHTKSTALAPYTIDTIDSTVTVYPANASSKCTRCGVDVASNEKDVRVTTWRRVEKAPVVKSTAKAATVSDIELNTIDWGRNVNRAMNTQIISSSLNDIKKTATLRNDTLFIHKRIAPFATLKEQVNKTTTVTYKNKPITFKTAVFDEAAFYSGKHGIEIY